jgi:hypothetical protein
MCDCVDTIELRKLQGCSLKRDVISKPAFKGGDIERVMLYTQLSNTSARLQNPLIRNEPTYKVSAVSLLLKLL